MLDKSVAMLELLIIISLAVLVVMFFMCIVLPVLALGLILIIPTSPLWFPVLVLEGPYEAGDWVQFAFRAVLLILLYVTLIDGSIRYGRTPEGKKSLIVLRHLMGV